MKLWFQKHTIIGRNVWLDEAYEAHLREVIAYAETEVHIHGLPAETYQGPVPADYVKFGQVEAFFAWHFAEQAIKAERLGYDAFIIGTSQDPGLDLARSLVSIPVLGYGETVFDFLRSQRVRFGVVGFIPELEEILRENLARSGRERQLVGFRYLEGGRAMVEHAISTGAILELEAAMTQCARELATEGAQVIVPGEGLPNEVLWAAGVRNLAGLPFIDANGLVTAKAEMLARLRALGVWDRGTNSYHTRRVSPEELDRFRELFGSRGACN